MGHVMFSVYVSDGSFVHSLGVVESGNAHAAANLHCDKVGISRKALELLIGDAVRYPFTHQSMSGVNVWAIPVPR